VVETIDPVLGNPRGEQRRVVVLTGGGEKDDRVGVQASRDEREHVRGWAIEPAGVLDEQQQRPVRRGLGEEVEHRHRGAEREWRRVVREPEGGVEGGR